MRRCLILAVLVLGEVWLAVSQGLNVAAPATVTTEALGTVAISVSLLTTPTADVTISVSSSNTDEGTVAPSLFVITAAFATTVQTVTVTGVNDFTDDGDITYVVTINAFSTDSDYNAKSQTVTLSNTDNDAKGITATASSTTTTEAGASISYGVKLDSQPIDSGAGIVTVSFTSDDTTEGSLFPSSLVFSIGNWNVVQTVTVTGVDDLMQDGNIAYNVAATVTTTTDYSATTLASLALSNTDNDVAAVTVFPSTGTTTEKGGVQDVTVKLATQPLPSTTVTLSVTSSLTSEGTANATTLTFTETTWNVQQTVRITGQDESVDDGDVSYTVTFAVAAGSDAAFIGKSAVVSLQNTDDDTAGLVATPTTGVVTTEATGTGTFTLALLSQPTGNVVVSAVSSDTTEGTIAPASVTFTTANWNVATTLTLTGVEDFVDDGDVAYTVTLTADAAYGSLTTTVGATNTDDDVPGITVSSSTAVTTTEAGTTATFLVVLTSQPTSSVTIPLISADTTEGTIDKNTLIFTATDWKTQQTVTVTGVDDLVQDGDIKYFVQLQAATSSDVGYSGRDAADVEVTNTDDDTASVVVSTSALTTTEAGAASTFSVTLNSEPTHTVLVTPTSSDTTEGTVSPSSLSFTTTTWSVPQSFTVTGVDDFESDGDVTYKVKMSVTSSDPRYNGMNPTDLTYTNQDDDAVAVSITPTSGLTTTEKGGTAQFLAVLKSRPAGTGASSVTIPLSVDTTEGSLSASSVVFTSGNWNVTQTITVTGVDDSIQDGNMQYQVTTGSITSTDSDYNGIDPDDVTLTNSDDDTDSITVSPTTGTTTEAQGGTGSTQLIAVQLNTQPAADVSFSVASSDTTEGTLNASSLTFTATNWNVAQSIAVTGKDDLAADGNVQYSVTVAVTSGSAAGYLGITQTVTMTNTDDDSAGIDLAVTGGTLVTTEAGGTGTISVTLKSEPAANVALLFVSSDTTEASVSPASLVFTSSNWNTAQTTTVTGVDDNLVDGTVAYQVSYTTTTTDTTYALSAAVAGSNTDNDVAQVSVAPTAITVQESGSSTTFAVTLSSQPTGSVVMSVATTDATESSLQPNTLVFTATNWNVAQTVTVTGVDDKVDDGDVTHSVQVKMESSVDAHYAALDPPDVAVTTIDDDGFGFQVVPSSGLQTTEAGGVASFVVVLKSQPTADVSISLPLPGSEVSVSPSAIVFTTTSWDTPVTVTCTGLDDSIDDGDQLVTITSAIATSGDVQYGGAVLPTISITNVDNDATGIVVSPTGTTLATTEGGGLTTFTLVLTSQPSYDVSVPLSVSDASEGVLSANSVVFTTSTWATPQSVSLTGVDDNVADGDVAYTVTISKCIALDPLYQALPEQTLSATNADDDVVGVSVLQGATRTSEGGGSFEVTVQLKSKPQASVTLSVTTNDTTEATVSTGTLTFAPDVFNVPQTITVTGVDDDVADGMQGIAITVGAPTTTDTAFAALSAVTVTGFNEDNDAAGLVVTPTSGLVTSKAGGSTSFSVMLSSQPQATVAISLTVSDAAEGSVQPTSLDFSVTSWNVAQVVTVSGVDDSIDDGNKAYSIAVKVSSSADTRYLALDEVKVLATNVDDDTAGFNVTEATGLTTSEAGKTASFNVVLTSQPSANVVVSVLSTNTDEGVVSVTSLLFTASSWAISQAVQVTGKDDFVRDGDIAYEIRLGAAVSSDTKYRGLTPPAVPVVNTDDDSSGVDVAYTGVLQTTEAGATVSVVVTLNSQPSSDVTVIISGVDTTEARFSMTRFAFSPTSWAIPQTVTVTGVDDAVADGDITYTVTLTTETADAHYAPFTKTLSFINADDDAIGISLDPMSVVTSELGATAAVMVKLTTEPTADVVIKFTTSDATEGTTTDALTFSAATWAIPQTLWVTGVDDSVADGNATYTVAVSASQSSDVLYAALALPSVSCVNVDDDVKGVTVLPTSGLETSEAQSLARFTVVLNSEPLQQVTIPVTSSDVTEGEPTISSLQFTPTNWNTPQTISITGVDDSIDDGDMSYQITLGTTTGYYGIDPADVNVTNKDDDTAGVSVIPSTKVVSEAGTTTSFTAVLTSEPQGTVTVTMESNDTSEGTVSTSSLVFTLSTWQVPQTVVVSGVDDSLADGDVAFAVSFALVASDAQYTAITLPQMDFLNVDNDTRGIIVGVVPATALTETTEAGGTLTFQAVLSSQPTADVTFAVQSSDETEVKPSSAAFVFTSSNWNSAQYVDVVGVGDVVDDGDQVVSVSFGPSVSADAGYSGIAAPPVSVTNKDDDTVGITVYPNNTIGLQTDETGQQATFTVVLNSEPVATVVISLSTSDVTEGAVAPLSLEFSPTNWFTPKTVTITGQPDNEDDGYVEYAMLFAPLASKDPKYHGMSVTEIVVVNAPLNCSVYTCPAGKVNNNKHCSSTSCTTDECCTPSCATYTCTSPAYIIANATSVLCDTGVCKEEVCCEENCGTYTCPAGTVQSTLQCAQAGRCTLSECCKESCDGFTCGAGFLAKASPGGCPASGCSALVCCDVTCSQFTCPTGYLAKTAAADTLRCTTGVCTPNACCDGTCFTYSCTAPLSAAAGAETTRCGTVCDPTTCCENKCTGVTCTAPDVCRTNPTCEALTGTCSEGTPISDMSMCTLAGATTAVCVQGSCVAAITCGSNTCVPTDPQCKEAGCTSGTCSETDKPDGTGCNDGDSATVNDACTSGLCAGLRLRCNTFSTAVCSLRSDASSIVCPSSGCDAPTCCSTCSTFDAALCASKQVAQDTCPKGGCTEAACCVDLCASVVCQAADACHTVGTCDAATGYCSEVLAADGTACDDLNAETSNDACQGGACSGTCANGCAANEPRCSKPVCGTLPCAQTIKADATPCNDENPLTLGDRCILGTCTGNVQTCATSNMPNTCLVSTKGTAECTNGCTEALCCEQCNTLLDACPINTVKDTNIACPVGGCTTDACCVADKCLTVDCSPEEPCMHAGVCDSLTGACSTAMKADNVGCSDGDSNTLNDRCESGICVGTPARRQVGAQIVLNRSFFQVTSSKASVEALLGSVAEQLSTAGVVLSDMYAVSLCATDTEGKREVSSCIPGTAVDHLTDTSGSASSGFTLLHFTGSTLESNITDVTSKVKATLLPGTILPNIDYTIIVPQFAVSSGLCAFVFCEPPIGCIVSTCNELTGTCSESHAASGTVCSDGDTRTSDDTCASGACVGTVRCSTTLCRAANTQCHVASCGTDGTCGEVSRADGAACTDGNPSTVNDRCQSGVCRGMNLCDGVVCAQNDACGQVLACDPSTGTCKRIALADGTQCDDGDVSTSGDKCVSGTCIGSVACAGMTCFPSEPECYTSACVNSQCTQHPKQDWTPCDDGRQATSDDHCISGVCVGSSKCDGVVCTAALQCMEAGHCIPDTGECTEPITSDGVACDDGDATTSGDRCAQGVCVGTVVCAGTTCHVNDTQCHTAACGNAGECTIIAKPDGTTCTDFNSATIEDHCVQGSCIGTDVCANVVCKASDSCHYAGVCDPTLGVCKDPQKPFGAECDDGNPNTMTDRCIDGVCRGAIACSGSVCTPSAPKCNVASCQNGQCIQVPTSSATCNDENPLTLNDQCSGGTCVGVNPCLNILCVASDSCHVAGKCDPLSGRCSDPIAADGTLCDDNSANSVDDTCLAGVCVGVVPCGVATCAPRLTKCMAALCSTDICTEVEKPDGTPCNDDDVSTSGDECRSGACVGTLRCGGVDCIVNEPQCYTAVCSLSTCEEQRKPEGTQCNDGLAATAEDRCVKGVCTGVSKCSNVVCSASDSCHHIGTCNEATGLCTDPPKADRSTCDDGRNTTTDDRCESGVCVGSILCGGQLCGPLQPLCHTARCINNQCVQVADPPGTSCNDGNASTTSDICSQGTCRGVDLCAGVVCVASDYCHAAGKCNPLTGICDDPMKPDGTICDDGISTTSNDRCLGGSCSGTVLCSKAKCSAGNLDCQEPRCESGGCALVNRADGMLCNDGNDGTHNDVCVSGTCLGTDRCKDVTCVSINSCHTLGTCDSTTGLCTEPRKAEGSSCDLGQASVGTCTRGSCVASLECQGVPCELDDPQCHISTCTSAGCGSVQKSVGTSCDDGDPSTTGDRCGADGGCSGTVACGGSVCVATNGPCFVPRCTNGQCVDEQKPDGTACDDGDAATTGDSCANGKCSGVDKCAGVVCDGVEVCATQYCDQRTGTCLRASKDDGIACNDDRDETEQDTCRAGVCVGILSCSGFPCPANQQQCLEPLCVAGTCDVKWRPDGTACDDGDSLTRGDECHGGSCVGSLVCGGRTCTTEQPMCTTFVCEGGQCIERSKPDGTQCSDGAKKTSSDICKSGVCTGEDLCASVECTATDECHAPGVCITHLGICTDPLKEDGTSCDDGSAFTVSDKCTVGACAGTQSCAGLTCKPTDPKCHDALCVNSTCTEVAKADSTPCNDEDVTTLNDRCQGGKCVGDSKCAGTTCKASVWLTPPPHFPFHHTPTGHLPRRWVVCCAHRAVHGPGEEGRHGMR